MPFINVFDCQSNNCKYEFRYIQRLILKTNTNTLRMKFGEIADDLIGNLVLLYH